MTSVLLYKGSEGKLSGYRVSGHAGFARAGQDIVCAAISFMSIACANALERVAGMKPEVTEKDALLEVKLHDPKEQALTTFKVFESGMRDLKEAYPTHIKLSEAGLPK